MPHLPLTEGSRYRVLCETARLIRMVPCGPVQMSESRPLAPGDIITHIGSRTGWGSDPGVDSVFVTGDGWEGALYPAGIWGGVSDTTLVLAE